MQKDVQRLLRRLAILAVLVTCAVVITAERQPNTVFAANYCQYCTSFHGGCYNYCQEVYDNCVLHYPQPQCSDDLYHCALECDSNLTFCQTFCDTGGGGGGGGGTKGPCGNACYAARADCLMDDPPPEWIEDCLNEGGNRHTCCNTVFYDCMAGC